MESSKFLDKNLRLGYETTNYDNILDIVCEPKQEMIQEDVFEQTETLATEIYNSQQERIIKEELINAVIDPDIRSHHNLEKCLIFEETSTTLNSNSVIDLVSDIKEEPLEEPIKEEVFEDTEVVLKEESVSELDVDSGEELNERVLSLNGQSYVIIPIEWDENCLFSSLSYIVYGTTHRNMEVRLEIIQHVVKSWDRFQQQQSSKLEGDSYSSVENYLFDMGRSETYGTFRELKAATEIYSYRFEVWMDKILLHVFGEEGHPVRWLSFTEGHSGGHFDVLKPYSLPLLNVTMSQRLESNEKKRIMMQVRRAKEDKEMRRIRLEKNRVRAMMRRLTEKEEDRTKRLEEGREREILRRLKENEEKRINRLEKSKKRAALRRLMETDEERRKRLVDCKEREALRRLTETEEKKIKRLEESRKRTALRRLMETEEEKRKRLEQSKIREASRRLIETEEKRKKRLEESRKRIALRRLMETEEERQKRLEDCRIRIAIRRSMETDQERRRRLEESRKRMAERRLKESEQERWEKLEAENST